MTIHPKSHRDLMLAPVAVEIDLNLQRLRDRTPEDVEAELELELDKPAIHINREERAELVSARRCEMSRCTVGPPGSVTTPPVSIWAAAPCRSTWA